MGTRERRNLKIIAIISVVNILIAGYLLYTKYSGAKSFCDFSPEISCDAVSQSPYAELPANSGIPVAGLGVIAFLLFLIPTLALLRQSGGFLFSRPVVHRLLLVWGIFSLLFYVYLTYLELYVIYALCPLCIVTFALTIVLLPFLADNVRLVKKKEAS
ncbi:MAG: vitamin K epoxide reductase family protein [Candidatus Aenigmarchaeota archaeon]|nr:vitamin K epoxide reductase family protein [Candidatus Aenigmarchaeota archaeon]